MADVTYPFPLAPPPEHEALATRLANLSNELDLHIEIVNGQQRANALWHPVAEGHIRLTIDGTAGPADTHVTRTIDYIEHDGLRQDHISDPRAESIRHNGQVFGEIRPDMRTVFLHFDAWNSQAANTIWWDLIDPAIRRIAELVNFDPRDALTTWADDQGDVALNAAVARTIQAQEQVAVSRRDLSRVIASHRAAMQDEQRLREAGDSGFTERLIREYELLADHSRVQSVTFQSRTLTITTTDDFRLTRPDTGDSRWLGQFVITIDLRNFRVRFENTTTMRGDRSHPHITDGTACFGGHEEDFAEVLGRYELFTWFELVCQYLETLNLNDEYGRYGAYWFDLPDERPIEQEVAA